MTRYVVKPAMRDAVLAAIPATGAKLQDLLPLMNLHPNNARQGLVGLCNDGLLFRCRARIGTRQPECFYFTDMQARNAFHDQYLKGLHETKKADDRARYRRKNEKRKAARAARIAAKRAEILAKREALAAEKAERARLLAERRVEKEAEAAARAARRREASEQREREAKAKKLAKAKKVITSKPGRKQVSNAQGVQGLRHRETKMIELRNSNKAKLDPKIPEGLEIQREPTNPALGNRFYVDPESVPRFKYGSGVAA